MEKKGAVERMWKKVEIFINDKQPHKYIMTYFIFIWWNFIICLLPIMATYFFRSSETVILSSFLAYCFTTLAITLFVYTYRNRQVMSLVVTNAGFLITVGFMVIYMFVFFIFNYDKGINLFMSSNMMVVSIVVFVPMFIITLILNMSFLNEFVLANKPKYVKDTIDNAKRSGDEVINNLKTGGI